VEVLFRSHDVLAAVEEGHKFAARMLMAYQRVRLEDRVEPLTSATGFVSHLGEMLEMGGYLMLVPCEQNGFDVWEILVERGPSDARLLGDLRHRHRPHAVLGDQPLLGKRRRDASSAT
jgi:hypothetical protein